MNVATDVELTDRRLVSDDAAGWPGCIPALVDNLIRGDNTADVFAVLDAFKVLRLRDPTIRCAILAEIINRDAISVIAKRLQNPVPIDLVPASIWWREVCLARIADLECLAHFVHCMELTNVIAPARPLIIKSLRGLLESQPFRSNGRCVQISIEMIFAFVLYAPDFSTFVDLYKADMFTFLVPVIADCNAAAPKSEWTVYDVDTSPKGLLIVSICLRIFTFTCSECVYAIMNSPNDVSNAKLILAQIEALPVFPVVLDAVRREYQRSLPLFLFDVLNHLPTVFLFGGRMQCTRRENHSWIDPITRFLHTTLSSFSSPFEEAQLRDGTSVKAALRNQCLHISQLIADRHDPQRQRQTASDLRIQLRPLAEKQPRSFRFPPDQLALSSSRELISSDLPIDGNRCQTCNKTASPGQTLKKCGQCNKVFYCSSACQRNDWKAGHKQKCAR